MGSAALPVSPRSAARRRRGGCAPRRDPRHAGPRARRAPRLLRRDAPHERAGGVAACAPARGRAVPAVRHSDRRGGLRGARDLLLPLLPDRRESVRRPADVPAAQVSPRLVALLSDFGSAGPYPAQMRLVLAALTDAVLVEITHDVPRHDVRTGAYLLRAAASHAPAGTIHLAVVDPGVGTGRRALIVQSGGQCFVGPDTGLLMPAARTAGAPRAFVITDAALLRGIRSSTFHGRDLFAPAAALLARGTPPAALGAPSPDVVDLDLGRGERAGLLLRGTVLYVDAF